VDQHRFDADPDPDFDVDADPDPDSDWNQNNAHPQADPTPKHFEKSQFSFYN
jgi:hypothetical protein